MLEKIISAIPLLILQENCTTIQVRFYGFRKIFLIRHMAIGTYFKQALIQCICITGNRLSIQFSPQIVRLKILFL